MIKNIILILLISTGLFAQIPDGYYDGTEDLYGDALKSVLNDIIDNHNELSYADLWDALCDTDEDPNNSDNVIQLYTGWSVSNSGYPIWNREHVWAKSHGDFGNTAPCGTDIHHIRPSHPDVNSARGNKDFDNGGTQHSIATGCYYDGDSWEARDEVKGDVARMIFYMATRYEGENGELDLIAVDEVNTSPAPEHGKLSTLLEWNTQDPPDEFEQNRNDRIHYNWQGNRNPFIDHPEFVDMIWNPVSANEDQLSFQNFKLLNYPNPFNPTTTFSFSLIAKDVKKAKLIIYNMKGQKIRVLECINHVNAKATESLYHYSVTWNGTDDNTQPVSSGIYLYRLEIDNKTVASKRCILLK